MKINHLKGATMTKKRIVMTIEEVEGEPSVNIEVVPKRLKDNLVRKIEDANGGKVDMSPFEKTLMDVVTFVQELMEQE